MSRAIAFDLKIQRKAQSGKDYAKKGELIIETASIVKPSVFLCVPFAPLLLCSFAPLRLCGEYPVFKCIRPGLCLRLCKYVPAACYHSSIINRRFLS